MPFEALCCCSRHSEWKHGRVDSKQLRQCSRWEAKVLNIAEADPKNKDRKRKICIFCRSRLEVEVKCCLCSKEIVWSGKSCQGAVDWTLRNQSGKLYQKIPVPIFVGIHSLNLSETTISSSNFIRLTTAAIHLRALKIERCGNITEDAIFQSKYTLQRLRSVDISFNPQFGILAIACICSNQSIQDICFNGINWQQKNSYSWASFREWQIMELIFDRMK